MNRKIGSGETISAWLANAGLRNLLLEEMVDGFARRLNEAGVPAARLFVGMNTCLLYTSPSPRDS